MLKHLLTVVLLFSYLGVACAQSVTDTLKRDLSKLKLPDPDSAFVAAPKEQAVTGHLGPDTIKAGHPSTTDSLVKKDTAFLKADNGIKKHIYKSKAVNWHPLKTNNNHNADSALRQPAKTDSLGKLKAKSDTIEKHSPVSTLTYAQYDAYTKGDDINGFSTLAESNHYPLPDKVLKVGKQVGLTPLQTSKITELATNLARKKKEMGVFIIRNEGVLDSLFRNNKLNDGLLIFYTNRSGLYYGELRNAILQACYATKQVLTPLQIKRFEAAKQPE